jgi:hypothetical protein
MHKNGGMMNGKEGGMPLAKKKGNGKGKQNYEGVCEEWEVVRNEEVRRRKARAVLMTGCEGWVLPRIFSMREVSKKEVSGKRPQTHHLLEPKLPLYAERPWPPATTLFLEEGVPVMDLGVTGDPFIGVAYMDVSIRTCVHVVFTAVGTSVDVPASWIQAVRDSVFILAEVAVWTMGNEQQDIFSPEGVCTHVAAADCDWESEIGSRAGAWRVWLAIG